MRVPYQSAPRLFIHCTMSVGSECPWCCQILWCCQVVVSVGLAGVELWGQHTGKGRVPVRAGRFHSSANWRRAQPAARNAYRFMRLRRTHPSACGMQTKATLHPAAPRRFRKTRAYSVTRLREQTLSPASGRKRSPGHRHVIHDVSGRRGLCRRSSSLNRNE